MLFLFPPLSELQRVLSESGALPLRSLVIIPDKQVWLVNIDVIVMDNGGNLLDAIVMAVKAAMITTTYVRTARMRAPASRLAAIDSCSALRSCHAPTCGCRILRSLRLCPIRMLSLCLLPFSFSIPPLEIVTGDGGAAEIIVNDDPFSNIPLPGASRLPLTVTLCKIGGANEWIIDATADEEQCSSMRLTLSLSPSGRMCGLSKGGVGTINLQALDAIMAHAAALGVQLNNMLTNEVKRGRGEIDEDGEAVAEVKRPVAVGAAAGASAAAAADGKAKGKGSKKKNKQAMTD